MSRIEKKNEVDVIIHLFKSTHVFTTPLELQRVYFMIKVTFIARRKLKEKTITKT